MQADLFPSEAPPDPSRLDHLEARVEQLERIASGQAKVIRTMLGLLDSTCSRGSDRLTGLAREFSILGKSADLVADFEPGVN